MHIPVLAEQAMEWLRVRGDGTYVDCTAGAGGHSSLIAEGLTTGRLIAMDCDPSAVAATRSRLKQFKNATVVQSNYGDIRPVLASLGIHCVDGILLDAGVSSMQIDTPGRGFSFQSDGPLDMRMTPDAGLSAAEFLARTNERELTDILRKYGDLRKARKIAAAILRRCKTNDMNTTTDLAQAVSDVYDFVSGVPAETRMVFQAIRIAVNEELQNLEKCIEQAIGLLAPEGRLVVISFHSGEDRIVKNIMRSASRKHRELYPDGRVQKVIPPLTLNLTPKPILPTSSEIAANSRAHSAKLRAVERLCAMEEN